MYNSLTCNYELDPRTSDILKRVVQGKKLPTTGFMHMEVNRFKNKLRWETYTLMKCFGMGCHILGSLICL